MDRKPVPRIDDVNAPFFAACNEERLTIQRCAGPDCRRHVYYPRVCCPFCHGGEMEWVTVSGRGRIVTSTVIHRPHHDGFASAVPYIFAAVRIEEGPIIFGRVEADPGASLAADTTVEPVFVQHTPSQKLLAFRLASATAHPH